MNFINHFTHPFKTYSAELKLTIFLFILGIVIGLSGIADIEEIKQAILEKFASFKDIHGVDLFWSIFLNNFQASAIAFYAGIFFMIIPFTISLANGLVIGLVLPMSDKPIYETILKLIPHGIFELPAIFLAIALGFSLGKWVKKEEKITYIKEKIIEGTTILLTVIMPFLLIAAVIESVAIEIYR